ncbi:hypothetical protein ATO8_08631 [Roseivivax marinus]|uniref:Uncharacterized protein n=1 Tax=Roseivivax marinus TaxID=1379903 RepID=W4HKK7_9RHOB|nr:cache domain-containing protein [Roseivivax marinus]ETW13264.1 hypothetical protein ATO8_08631 [Roseivivax marinus]
MTAKPFRILALAAFLAPVVALAEGGNAAMTSFVTKHAREWAADPVISRALATANRRHADLTQAEIDDLDAAWQAEIGAAETPVIDAVTESEASAILREAVADASGRITEIILMDTRGLNVAISSVTSDYWQGDEAKFLKTVPAGPDAVHQSEIEFDESMQIYHVQVSVPVLGAAGDPVGAVTVGLDVDAF